MFDGCNTSHYKTPRENREGVEKNRKVSNSNERQRFRMVHLIDSQIEC